METHNLICINCPLGCALTVSIDEQGKATVTGNTCPRGADYGYKEVTNPTRTVTSTVRVINGHLPVVSVKTSSDVPKSCIGAVMDAIRTICVTAPVSIGQILLKNVGGTGVDVVATKSIRPAVSPEREAADERR